MSDYRKADSKYNRRFRLFSKGTKTPWTEKVKYTACGQRIADNIKKDFIFSDLFVTTFQRQVHKQVITMYDVSIYINNIYVYLAMSPRMF